MPMLNAKGLGKGYLMFVDNTSSIKIPQHGDYFLKVFHINLTSCDTINPSAKSGFNGKLGILESKKDTSKGNIPRWEQVREFIMLATLIPARSDLYVITVEGSQAQVDLRM